MTLHNFLKLHVGGTACVSIHQNQFSANHKTFFEEEEQERIVETETYRKIRNYQVERFCVIGGGGYPVELSIFLEE